MNRYVAVMLSVNLVAAGCGHQQEPEALPGSRAVDESPHVTSPAVPRLDTSSPQAQEASWKQITADMSPEEKKQFLLDIEVLAYSQVQKAFLQSRPPSDAPALGPYDGMTADELHQAADSVRQQLRVTDHTTPSTSNAFVGSWRADLAVEGGSAGLEFHADGKCALKINVATGLTVSAPGTWQKGQRTLDIGDLSISFDTISISFEENVVLTRESTPGQTKAPRTTIGLADNVRFPVMWLNPDRFIAINISSGAPTTYLRNGE